MSKKSNLHTEAEARLLWCPLARYVGDEHGVGLNRWPMAHMPGREDLNPPECCCIASECMLWRWDDENTGHCGLGGALP